MTYLNNTSYSDLEAVFFFLAGAPVLNMVGVALSGVSN